MALFYTFAWVCFVVSVTETARILAVFPVPSICHQVVFRPITQELVKRGHEVTVITPDPAFKKGEAPANLTEIDVHDISYKIWIEHFMKTSRGNKNDLSSQLEQYLYGNVLLVEAQLQDERVQRMLNDKNQKFDLILSEASVRPALVYSHLYKVPIILVSSLGAGIDNYATIGAPTHTFLYPALTRQKLNNLTLWEKVTEFYTNYIHEKTMEDMKIVEHNMLKKNLGSDVPSIDELNNNIQMLLLNINPIFEGIRPVPPTVVYMGGLHQKSEKELPGDLKTYLDLSKNGVLYLSFGTNVDPSQLSPEKIQILIRVFSQLPYDVLWEWNQDELPGRTKNIKISKSLPQSDLLRHPKIKLFITQGDLQSTDEAITAGVPLIGIPMLGDQWFNVEKYEYHKIGIKVDMENLTEEKLKNAIVTINNDNSYRRNIVRLRNQMHDEPMKPLERGIWWIEYVLRHGGTKHLRSPAANINWTQYLELELVFIVLVAILTITAAILIILRFIYNFVLKNYFNMKTKSA